MKKIFLLDAYALIFRSYYAFIKNPRVNSKGLNTSAIFGFTNTLIELIRKENPDFLAVCFDPSGPNFRHELYPEYKANRDATPEDIKLSVPHIKNIIEAMNIPVIEVKGFEADDLIGTLSKRFADTEHHVYMMTPDKDYAQLVANNIYMYKPGRSGSDIEILGVEEVKNKFKIENPLQVIDILALWGDSSDNIPGAPGIGEKTAQKLIETYGSVENLLENTADLKGKQKENLESHIEQVLLSKQLATIDTNVPVEIELNNLKMESPDLSKIKSIFDELEFRSLYTRIAEQNYQPTTKISPQSTQLDLFASIGTSTEISVQNTHIKTAETTEHNYRLTNQLNEFEQFVDELSKQKAWCFDTETTGLDPITSELVGLSFSWKAHQAYYIPFDGKQIEKTVILEKLKPLFENPDIEKVGQNIKYDMLILKQYGINLKGDLFDTMIAHYLLQPDLRHNMDYLSEVYLMYKPISIETLIGKKGAKQGSMSDVELETIKEYAAEDADITWQLSELFKKDLKNQNLSDLYYEIEMPLIYVLTDMEHKGVSIDIDFLKNYSKILTESVQKIEQEIYELAGEVFNIASPKQLGPILFDKLKITDQPPLTKTKQYKTGEDVLVKYLDEHPIVEKILKYRGQKKLISTYVDALPELVNPKTKRVHTSFNQTVASTGRLSSTNPNLQNIPIREAEGREVRKSFVTSDNEHIFLSADYSQVELRLMAHLSQDENMIQAFKSGEDIHAATAAKIFKKPIDLVTKEERSQAKSANFGIIYGISAFGLSQNIKISRSDAKALIDGYFETYPKVKTYMERSIAEARQKGFVSTLFGRKRLLNDINSQNAIVRGVAERNAINAPLQGSAADIIKLAMIGIYNAFETHQLKSEMLIQVHDELNFNVLKSELDIVKQIVKEEMERAVSLSVPLIVDMGEGKNWFEAH
ncbi:MAG: DNA polymerase I [Bacteroidales bacterium]|nr:DNA polymerase I [Bacteroidales bacterium]